MRFYVKMLLFLSSYTPLFLILGLKNWDSVITIDLFKINIHINLLFFAIAIISILLLLWIIKFTKKDVGEKKSIEKIKNANVEAVSYIITYIIPILEFGTSSWGDIISLLILLVVIAMLYIKSDMIHINPMLTILGYDIYKEKNSADRERIFISKKHLANNSECAAINLTNNIYLCHD